MLASGLTAFGLCKVLSICAAALVACEGMAWESHGTDNDSLVDALKRSRIIVSKNVEMAMRAVDRGLFVPKGTLTRTAYQDAPVTIGYGATISAPHMHAHCLELLEPYLRPGAKVLDVGSGSGYLTAVMAYMVGLEGSVLGVEHIPELVEASRRSVASVGSWARQAMESGQLQLVVGDGRAEMHDQGPFDVIHVGAASPRLPQNLLDLLAPGGLLLVPVGPEGGPQNLVAADKALDGRVSVRDLMGVIYVPLTVKEHQLTRA